MEQTSTTPVTIEQYAQALRCFAAALLFAHLKTKEDHLYIILNGLEAYNQGWHVARIPYWDASTGDVYSY